MNIDFFKILSQIDKTIDEAIPELLKREASIDISKVLQESNNLQFDLNKRWLLFLKYRISSFLIKHPDILVTRSDKGGHTVIMNVKDYDEKLNLLLNCDSYLEIDMSPLDNLIKKEINIVGKLSYLEPVKALFKNISFTPDCLNLPSLYGLPKIHKAGIPLRPITPTINTPSHFTAKLFLKILERIFPRTEYHIRDTFEFIRFIRNTKIELFDVLVSFDVVSMYTNIPFTLAYDIILKQKQTFLDIFGMNRELLVTLLRFTLKDCMYFTALGKIYQQRDGLPMGSCLSPLIARIVMDEVTYILLKEVPEITFIRIFVDDTIVAVRLDLVNKALEVLNHFLPGKIIFTKEIEINGSINFLNTTLIRKIDHIETNWYRKSFASGRLLNFFSSHKRSTIINTAVHFIETIILISDGNFFEDNKNIIYNVLRENSFPESLITILMNSHFTLMKPICNKTPSHDFSPHTGALQPLSEENGQNNPYVIYPQAVCENRKIKKILYKLKKQKSILTESTKNTRDHFITTRKTKIPLGKQGNLILFSRCNCGAKICATMTKYGECGFSGVKRILTTKNICTSQSHAYNKVKLIKGLFYNNQTKYLLKYIQWICRRKLDAFHMKYEFPTPCLSRLVVDVDNPYKFFTNKLK